MKTRTLPALGATAALLGTLVVAAPAASAGTCTITGYSPSTVVVGLSPVVKTFGVSAKGCSVESWDVDVAGTFLYAYDSSPQEVFSPYSLWNSDAGVKYAAVVEVNDSDWNTTKRVFNNSFSVKRRTSFTSFNASPEPVKKGKPITVSTTLKVANWDSMRYDAQKGSTVSVQFKKKGTSSWKTVKTTRSSTSGRVSTSVTASSDGTWRVYYYGSGTRGPAVTTSDYVDVR